MSMLKRCTNCRKEKRMNDYHKNRSKSDGHEARCKSCVSIYKKDYYLRNAEALLNRGRRWRIENPTKDLARKGRWEQDNRTRGRARRRASTARLPDGYVNMLLVRGTGLSADDIPAELTEAKRMQIQLQRMARGGA